MGIHIGLRRVVQVCSPKVGDSAYRTRPLSVQTCEMKHSCLRCGLEASCTRGTWPDRHPAAAVALAVPSVLFALAAIGTQPWVFIPLLVLGGLAYMVDRERRRRHELSARADYEHRALVAEPLRWPPLPRAPRRRPADHWSATEPIGRIA